MHCLACHGADLGGVAGTGGAALIGGRDTIASGKPKKTVESYWPYASTLFDFTKRAMPFHTPGSLSDDDLYAVSAYILAEANIIGKDEVMNAETLPKVVMPNVDGFIPDPASGRVQLRLSGPRTPVLLRAAPSRGRHFFRRAKQAHAVHAAGTATSGTAWRLPGVRPAGARSRRK